MKENEVIITDALSDNTYKRIASEAIMYAIISKPFTIRRIGNQTLQQAIMNIFKGKLAEQLFRQFCSDHDINPDWGACSTPYWDIDRRDFIYHQSEWDIKNNIIYHSDELLPTSQYLNLPALIPNRKWGDQWDVRNKIKNIGKAGSTAYLFTFFKGATLVDNKRGPEFCRLALSPDQQELIAQLERKFFGKPTHQQPYDFDRFWGEMARRGSCNFLDHNFQPRLVITGYAQAKHWHLFKNTGPGDPLNQYMEHLNPAWYSKSKSGSVNFMNNTLWTTITNATCPMELLPSFLSLFPAIGIKKCITNN